jgi:hypothetical protein
LVKLEAAGVYFHAAFFQIEITPTVTKSWKFM